MVSAVVSNGISSGMAQGISNGPSSGIPNSTTYSDSSGDPGRASTASHAFLLSIINARDDAQPARLIPLIEAWIAEWEGTLLTRKRTCQVATADVQVANEKVEAFLADLKGKRGEWLAHHGCDVNVCHLPICERLQRVPGEFLFIFDLDSTLIQMECVDELARIAGKYEAVAVPTCCIQPVMRVGLNEGGDGGRDGVPGGIRPKDLAVAGTECRSVISSLGEAYRVHPGCP